MPFNKEHNFLKTKFTSVLLFIVKNYIIKMDIIRYYLSPNFIPMKHYNKKNMNIQCPKISTSFTNLLAL